MEYTLAVQTSCRTSTCEIGEPLAGSAGTAQALIAIAWPKPRWHAAVATLSDGLPSGLRQIELREKREGRTLPIRVFQRSSAGPTDRVEMLFFSRERTCVTGETDVPVAETPEHIERFLSGDQPGRDLSGPLLLVCTDGRHDRCCATYGHAMAEALRAEAERRSSSVQIAESSHLGGHRFAATCLSLPHGHLYGRLEPADAPELITCVEIGSVLRSRYRGAIGLSEPQQVAAAYVGTHFASVSELVFADPIETDGTLLLELSFRENGAARRLDLELTRRAFTGPTSCEEPAGSIPRSRWVLRAALGE